MYFRCLFVVFLLFPALRTSFWPVTSNNNRNIEVITITVIRKAWEVNYSSYMKFWPVDKRRGFPLSRNFYLRTNVNFKRVNKIVINLRKVADKRKRTSLNFYVYARPFTSSLIAVDIDQVRFFHLSRFIKNAKKNFSPGQNQHRRHFTKLGAKTHFAKLTRILFLIKARECYFCKSLFLLSPTP